MALLALGVTAGRFGAAQQGKPGTLPDVTIAPRSSALVAEHEIEQEKEPALSSDEKLKLIREHIKYVFVLFQENRSFDFYFGSYPGADGIYEGPEGRRPYGEVAGFTQVIVHPDGTVGVVSPFRIPTTVVDAGGKTVPIYPADLASVNHSHTGLIRKIALDSSGVAQNSEYALTEEGVTLKDGMPSKAPIARKGAVWRTGDGHVDCDTAPFLWQYADRFTLFDHFMDTIVGPSTPNAIAMIAGSRARRNGCCIRNRRPLAARAPARWCRWCLIRRLTGVRHWIRQSGPDRGKPRIRLEACQRT